MRRAAVGRVLDPVEAQAIDVDDVGRRLDLELGEVEKVGAAADELGAGLGGHGRGRFGRGLGPLERELLHSWISPSGPTPPPSLMAATMLG